MRLRAATLAALAAGAALSFVGIYSDGGPVARWLGVGFLGVASLLAMWIKWGPNGFGWELRRRRRQ